LPAGKNVYALYSNKAVFAQLGIEPPADGMTWDDVIELGRRIGGAGGATQEFILSVIDPSLIVSQLGIRLSPDGADDYDSPEWREAYGFFGRVAGIPGNHLAEHMNINMFGLDFRSFASGKTAMAASG
jgi:ABC-type glycerol-3-phosphate transport system substrate-binding protein